MVHPLSDNQRVYQGGVSLIIVFLVMVIIVAVVLSISTIMFNQINITASISNSTLSFYAVDTGIEKTLYFDRKGPKGSYARGFCNICSSCNDPSINPQYYCGNCILTPTEPGGCDAGCTSCQVDYASPFGDSNYTITANVPSATLGFDMDIKGYYKNVIRKVQLKN